MASSTLELGPVAPSAEEGFVAFNVPAAGKPCRTWYRLIGTLDNPQPPLVLLHGGPGSNHHYIASLADLHTTHGLAFIFYDQIGGGNSTRLPEKKGDVDFWTAELFMDELENLLGHFGLGPSQEVDKRSGRGERREYDVLGHSWGGMLASRFASSKRPAACALRRLVISNSPSAMRRWEMELAKQIQTFPRVLQDAVWRCEREGTHDDPDYQRALEQFMENFVIRVKPTPEEIVKSGEIQEADPTVNHTMNGPGEFTFTGPNKDWDVENELHNITAPTLLINGRYDTASDAAVEPFFKLIPHVKWVRFENSSHSPMWEERQRYMDIVGGFLTQVI